MRSVFDTASVPSGQRVDLWQEHLSEAFGTVDVTGYACKKFDCRIQTLQLGEIMLAHCDGVEQSHRRAHHMMKSSDTDAFVAAVQLGGVSSYKHGSRVGAQLGGITLFDMTREYEAVHHKRMHMIDVALPRRRVESLLGSTRNLAGLHIGPESPLVSVITAFLCAQLRVADLLEGETACRLGEIAAELLAAAFLETVGRVPGCGAACVVRAKAFVRSRIADPALSPETVAASQNLSLRRMQEVFATESLTITDYIWEQRLLRAHAMLASRAFDRLLIEDIAHAAGFTSQPHFSRRCRARFGRSPAEIRKGNGAVDS